MKRIAERAATLLCAVAAALTVLLAGQAWLAQSRLSAAAALLTALQVWCLFRIATGGIPNAFLAKAVLLWCVFSGVWLLLTTQSYIRNHGLEGWVDAAGASGFTDESGQFFLSMPPMKVHEAALSALFILSQGASGALVWRSKRRLREREDGV